jgi:plasmid stability protein
MAALIVRKIDDKLKDRLRVRAARNGHSMEEEVRAILRRSLDEDREPQTLGALALRLFGKQHGVTLEIDPRGPEREPPDFKR